MVKVATATVLSHWLLALAAAHTPHTQCRSTAAQPHTPYTQETYTVQPPVCTVASGACSTQRRPPLRTQGGRAGGKSRPPQHTYTHSRHQHEETRQQQFSGQVPAAAAPHPLATAGCSPPGVGWVRSVRLPCNTGRAVLDTALGTPGGGEGHQPRHALWQCKGQKSVQAAGQSRQAALRRPAASGPGRPVQQAG